MSPDGFRTEYLCQCAPRVSGDEPEEEFISAYSGECSPRERG